MTRFPRPFAIAAAAFVLALAAVACGGQQSGDGSMMGGGSAGSGSAASPGEAIFLSGVDASGASIPRTVSQSGGTAGDGMMGGGSGSGMMGGDMMNGGCANCHGRDGHGRTTSQFAAPDITYANLTDPKGMRMPDGTRDVTYTDAQIQTAVTQGLDPEGSQLEWPMPQWQLTDQEWGDLLAYLKTLP